MLWRLTRKNPPIIFPVLNQRQIPESKKLGRRNKSLIKKVILVCRADKLMKLKVTSFIAFVYKKINSRKKMISN